MKPLPILVLALALLSAPAALAAPAWLPAAPIPGEVTPAREAQAAFGSDGTLVVVWREGAGGTQSIKTATRPPGGPFGPVDTLVGPVVGLGAPRVALDGLGTALVTWVQGAGARFSVRPPGGSFSAGEELPRPAGEGVGSAVEVVFDAQGNALAAWVGLQTRMSGGIDFRLRASVRPPGGPFASPEALDSGFNNADAIGTPTYTLFSVTVATAGAGDLIAAWRRSCCLVGSETSDVRVAVRRPGGPFSPTETVDSGTPGTGTDVGGPHVAGRAQGSAIVVWTKVQSSSTENVAACARPPGGSFAGCAIEDVSGAGPAARSTSVGLDSQGNAVAVWSRKFPGGGDPEAVQTAARAAGGPSWTPLGTFSEPGTALTEPVLAVSESGSAVAAWRRGIERIDGAGRAPGGPFGASQALSEGAGNPVFPDVAMDPAGNGAAAWERLAPPDTRVEVAGYDGAGPQLGGLSIPTGGDTGQSLAFSVTPIDVWSPVQSIDWSFGDGSTASGPEVTHSYERVGGSFAVGVAAADSLGNVNSISRAILIRDTARPGVFRFRMTRRRFGPGPEPTLLVARRVPRGSVFRFRLSEPATVKIRLDRRRRAGRRTVYRRVGVLTRRGRRAGANSVRFSGRVRRRALKVGAYRATLRATDPAGNRSRPRTTTFRIVPRSARR